MKRLHRYVTEQDKMMTFFHPLENVRYWVEAFWDNDGNTKYKMVMFEATTGEKLDTAIMDTEDQIVWCMKEVSKDLRKWRVC